MVSLQEERDSPTMFLITTVYVSESSVNASRMSSEEKLASIVT